MSWLSENLGTIAVGFLLAVIVIAIIRQQIHQKKAGKNSCGCGCSSCAMSGSCHSHSAEKDLERMEKQIVANIHKQGNSN